MTTIGKLLHDKGSDVWATKPATPVSEALKLMAEKDIGVLLVMDGEALVGILSERDCARKITLPGKNASEIPVSEIMTARVLYVRADQSVEACMALMTEKHIRHLPVLGGDDRVIGVVSMGDVGRAIIADQEFTIAHLEHYITGSESMLYRS